MEKEKRELEIINSFLPKQLTYEELRTQVIESIERVSAKDVKDSGKVMKDLKGRIEGKVHPKKLGQVLKEMLDSKSKQSN